MAGTTKDLTMITVMVMMKMVLYAAMHRMVVWTSISSRRDPIPNAGYHQLASK
jgi:hypothetical protein